jgi:GNAT superfamily N-acetyltransferase
MMKELPAGLQIVRAQAFDAPRLSRIAVEAKRALAYPEDWIDYWRNELSISPSRVLSSETYCATLDGKIAGFYELRRNQRFVELEHLWVLPRHQRRGIGLALFAHAVERARECGFKGFVITSDPNAAGFYKKMGARQFDTLCTEVQGQVRELPMFVYDVA